MGFGKSGGSGGSGIALPTQEDYNKLTSGFGIFDRDKINGAAVSTGASGTIRFNYFTALSAAVINSVRIATGGTAAAATPTLCRIGVWEVAADGGLTLVASTPNDTTLFSTINTRYTKAFSAPWTPTLLQRYAAGPLIVSGAAVPTFMGISTVTPLTADAIEAPRLTGLLTAQTDLPASVAAGSITNSNGRFYMSFIP